MKGIFFTVFIWYIFFIGWAMFIQLCIVPPPKYQSFKEFYISSIFWPKLVWIGLKGIIDATKETWRKEE